MTAYLLLASVLCLLSTFCLGTTSTAFRRIRRHSPISQALDISRLFFYFKIQKIFFHKREFDILFFATSFAKYVFYFLGISTAVIAFVIEDSVLVIFFIKLLVLLLLSIFVGGLAPQLVARDNPEKTIKILAPIVSFLLTLSLPFSYIFLRLSPLVMKGSVIEHDRASQIKDKIIELIEETNSHGSLDTHHKKLIESVITFKDRIVREVMIPRINVFSFDISTILA